MYTKKSLELLYIYNILIIEKYILICYYVYTKDILPDSIECCLKGIVSFYQ